MPPHDNSYALVRVSTSSGDAYAEYLYVPPKLADLPSGYITGIALDPRGLLYFRGVIIEQREKATPYQRL